MKVEEKYKEQVKYKSGNKIQYCGEIGLYRSRSDWQTEADWSQSETEFYSEAETD